jgi:hypothetical protein
MHARSAPEPRVAGSIGDGSRARRLDELFQHPSGLPAARRHRRQDPPHEPGPHLALRPAADAAPGPRRASGHARPRGSSARRPRPGRRSAASPLNRFIPLGKRPAGAIPDGRAAEVKPDGRAARATGRALGMVKGGSGGPPEKFPTGRDAISPQQPTTRHRRRGAGARWPPLQANRANGPQPCHRRGNGRWLRIFCPRPCGT